MTPLNKYLPNSMYTYVSLLPALLLMLATGGCGRGQTEVAIRNVGDADLDSTVVHVTGHTYEIGTIPAGQTSRLDISVEDESHIEVSHAGSTRRLVFDVYLEPGYEGRIDASITADSVLSVEHHRGDY